MALRILLADDHKIMREGLLSLIKEQPGFEVVAEAENGREALKLVRQLKPDVVLMDINMPELNGIDATRQIVSEFPRIKIIAFSMLSNRQHVLGMLKAGVSGYMLKDCAFEELVQAIRTVAAKKIYLSPKIAGTLVEDYLLNVPAQGPPATQSALTQREREVLQMIAEGKSTKDIAARINLSAKTVETHRRNIMEKLKFNSTAELTKYAIREGLTSLDC